MMDNQALTIQTEESENVSNPLKERCQVTLAERETLRNTRHGTLQQRQNDHREGLLHE
jgi:hypothetical protein